MSRADVQGDSRGKESDAEKDEMEGGSASKCEGEVEQGGEEAMETSELRESEGEKEEGAGSKAVPGSEKGEAGDAPAEKKEAIHSFFGRQ